MPAQSTLGRPVHGEPRNCNRSGATQIRRSLLCPTAFVAALTFAAHLVHAGGGGGIGACCQPGNVCFEMDGFTCLQSGWVYHGFGTVCSPNPCGTCPCNGDIAPCGGDGIVELFDILELLNCFCGSGPDPCGVPIGSCDLNCDAQINIKDFLFLMREYGGAGVDPTVCQLTLGTCYDPDADECIWSKTQNECESQNDIYLGDWTICGSVSCGTTCYRCFEDGSALEVGVVTDESNPTCQSMGLFPTAPACLPRDYDGDPPVARGRGCYAGGANPNANPVHLFSGEKYEDVEDLRIPGRGLHFTLARTYRSQSQVQTPQGFNWDTSYNIYFEQLGPKLVLHSGDLRRDEFTEYPGMSTVDYTAYHRAEYFAEIRKATATGIITKHEGDGSTWVFNPLDASPSAGKIATMTDRHGNSMTFEYDGAGRLWKVRDPLNSADNRVVTFTYNPDGFLETVTDWAGREVRYEYYQNGDPDGSFGDLKSVAYPEVTTTTGNNFTGANRKKITYKYYVNQTDPALNHNLKSVTDAKGQEFKTLTYGTSGDSFDRVTVQNLAGDLIHYTHIPVSPGIDSSFAEMLVILKDRVGNVSHHFFDSANREVRTQRYTGRAPNLNAPVTLSANRPTGKLRASDPEYFETRTLFDTNSEVAYAQAADGQTLHNDIDEGNPDPRKRGNVMQRTQVPPPGDMTTPTITETFDYLAGFGSGGCCGGGSDFVTSYVDGRGNETTHDYDPLTGDRTTSTQPTVTLGVLGGGTQTIDESWTYNSFGQVTQHVNPTGRVDTFTYYASGTSYGYLECKTVDATAYALATCYEYDAVGNVIATTDARGHETEYFVNALNQVVRERSREVTGGSNVRYETLTYYDANNNVVRVDVQNRDASGAVQANSHFTTVNEYDVLNDLVRTCQESGNHSGAIPGPTNLPTCAGLPAADFVTTEYEYDRNKNRVLMRSGEAAEGRQPDNASQTVFDERDMVYQSIRGDGPGESVTQNDYDIDGNLIRTTVGVGDANPRVTTYAYDGLNRLKTVTDPEGNVTTHGYDNNNNRVSVRIDGERIDGVSGTNVRLREMTTVYDEINRVIQNQEAFFDIIGANIGDGQSTAKKYYNENSDLIRTEDDNGHYVDTSYDTANRRSTVTDQKGNMATFTYDANSNVTQIVQVDKSDLGNPDQSFTTNFVYDNLDRQVTITDNVGSTNTSFYDSRGNRVRTVDALDHEVRHHYDGLSRLLSTVRDLDGDTADGDGPDITTAQAWDDNSRLTAQIDDNGNATRYAYDALNRKIVTQMADGTIHQIGSGAIWPLGQPIPNLDGFVSGYDVFNNQRTTRDPNGSTTTNTYDLVNRLTGKSVVRATDVFGTTSETYQYDGLSRIVRAQDNDSIVIREYDSLGNATKETQTIGVGGPSPTTGIVVSSFDGVGNKLSLTYPGGRIITTAYDELNRKKIITDTTGAPQLIAEYHYVGAARVERRQYGNNTRTAYSYDGITGVPNPANDFGVMRIIRTRHTVIGVTCSVDTDCPTGNTCDGTGTCVIDDRTYTWDRMGNKTRRKDVRPNGPQLTHDYAYDAAYRLVHTTVTDSGAQLLRDTQYDLDGVGNRLSVTGPGTPDAGNYSLDAQLPEPGDLQTNQYSSTPFDCRRYDANGNLVRMGQLTLYGDVAPGCGDGIVELADVLDLLAGYSSPVFLPDTDIAPCGGDGITELADIIAVLSAYAGVYACPAICGLEAAGCPTKIISYDYRNMMIEYRDFEVDQSHVYSYDALGRRNAKIVDADDLSPLETRFLLDGIQEIEELAPSAITLATYAFGLFVDELLARRTGPAGETFACAADLYEVTALTSMSAATVERYEYGDYGSPTFLSPMGAEEPASVSGNEILFTGRRMDTETSEYFFRSRYLSPGIGRYTSHDRVGDWTDLANFGNGFTYAGNRPTIGVDPTGEVVWVPFIIAVGVVVLLTSAHHPDPQVGPPPINTGVVSASMPNVPWSDTLWSANLCPTRKAKRLRPIPGIQTITNARFGVSGGTHRFFPLPGPGQLIGTGGCNGCIGVIVKCPSAIAVFHFGQLDNPRPTIVQYSWPAGRCSAIICGGDDSHMSNSLADNVLTALAMAGIPVEGVSGGSCCGVQGDLSWYDQ